MSWPCSLQERSVCLAACGLSIQCRPASGYTALTHLVDHGRGGQQRPRSPATLNRWHQHLFAAELDGLLRASVAHLWFLTLHPYDDGNGRLARAIGDRLLAQACGPACEERLVGRALGLSAQILREREGYDAVLERCQLGDLDVTSWPTWWPERLSNRSAPDAAAPTGSAGRDERRPRGIGLLPTPRSTSMPTHGSTHVPCCRLGSVAPMVVGLDRQGWITLLAAILLALITLFASCDHVDLPGFASPFPLPQQAGIPCILAALAAAVGEAQLASNDREESRQLRQRTANEAAEAREREDQERESAAEERRRAAEERERASCRDRRQDRCALALLEYQLDPSPDNRIKVNALIALLQEASAAD